MTNTRETPSAADLNELLLRRANLRFIVDLAVRFRRDALVDPQIGQRTVMVRERIAGGTLGALLWVLGLTDMCPTSGHTAAATPAEIAEESDLSEEVRWKCLEGSEQYYYLGGVADGLAFALGQVRRFWWSPLPEALRRGRDEHGRAFT